MSAYAQCACRCCDDRLQSAVRPGIGVMNQAGGGEGGVAAAGVDCLLQGGGDRRRRL